MKYIHTLRMKSLNIKAVAIVVAAIIVPWQSYANDSLAVPSFEYDDPLVDVGRPPSVGWAEFSKQTKTLEKKLEWVFPSLTKYICPEKDGIGTYFNYDKGTQLSHYGNITLEISDLGKTLSIFDMSIDRFSDAYRWSQWSDEENDYTRLEMIYLSNTNGQLLSPKQRLASVHAGGCSEEQIFDLHWMQKPVQICVTLQESRHNYFSGHIVNCMLLR